MVRKGKVRSMNAYRTHLGRPTAANMLLAELCSSRSWSTAKELAEAIKTDLMHVSRKLTELVREGLVKRRVGDRRYAPYEYAVTPEGIAWARPRAQA